MAKIEQKIPGNLQINRELRSKKFTLFCKGLDTLVVWRLDRLGRSLKDLIEWVNRLEQWGVSFWSLEEAIDTRSSSGKLIFHIFAALAEFERNLIEDRTRAGLAAARARGRKGGRPKSLDTNKRQLTVELYQEKKLPIKTICEMMNISKPVTIPIDLSIVKMPLIIKLLISQLVTFGC